MRYAQIRSMDVSNGKGVGVALFVQGCHLRCHNCFNQSTWDFNGGKEWTNETEKTFFMLIDKPYIQRICILGGEPLTEENIDAVYDLIIKIRLIFKDSKKIWLYTGYNLDAIYNNPNEFDLKRIQTLGMCDVVVDGPFKEDQKDLKYKYAGSTNQRVIDIKKSGEQGSIVLLTEDN